MAETIAFVLRNLPVFLFVAALVFAWLSRSGLPIADRLLAWILLLPIGVTGLWAAVFHLFFPEIAAADIGWEPSPFQFEVGMADLAMGATACVSFWRSLDFKAAVVIINAIFLLGDAIGHVGTDDRCRRLRTWQRRRSLFRRHRLPRARAHSPDHRSAVRVGAANLLSPLRTRSRFAPRRLSARRRALR